MKKYRYIVKYYEPDKEWVGTCIGFPYLSWLDKKPEKALLGIMKLVKDEEKFCAEVYRNKKID